MPRIRDTKEWIRVPNWIRHWAQGFMLPENHAHPPVAMGLAVRGSGGWRRTYGCGSGVVPTATQMVVKTLELRESISDGCENKGYAKPSEDILRCPQTGA